MDHALATLTRRGLLQLGGWGYLGLNLGGLWRAQAASPAQARMAGPRTKLRSCILIFYYEAPSHLDTYDLKPGAPAEVRGEFKPIATTVPGIQVCEHLPRMARLMHKVAQVRSMHHTNRLHDSASIETLTGRFSPNGDREEFAPIKQFFPSHGAALNYLWRARRLEVPHVALPWLFHNVVDVPCQGAGFLGAAFDPLVVSVDPATRTYQAGALATPADLSADRLQQRRRLLSVLGPGSAGRGFYDRAFQLLGSSSLRNALDIGQEDLRVRERYGIGPARLNVGEGGGGGNGAEMGVAREMRGQNLLLARRLVEAGVPFVNVADFKQQGQNWDAHFKVFNQHKTHLLPSADQALSALIEDLDQRGLLDTTLVIALGEFGRTPKINREGGRDHWPDCYTVLLAGGGVKGGFVYGASDRLGAYPAALPVRPADLAATIFWRFGIDPATEIHDVTGRPYKLAEGEVLRKLFVGEG